jgi:hypothetical protein
MFKVTRADQIITVTGPTKFFGGYSKVELASNGIGIIRYLEDDGFDSIVENYVIPYSEMTDLQIVASVCNAVIP